ncbi:MAG: hypothetical protein JXR70_00945 [Spirochaetales bacterium]|nr:hypothetical protein [Spirochaetales bacterium]
MKQKIFVTLFIIAACYLYSQEIHRQVTIPFGSAENQITIDQGGGEHWKPLFFDIDAQGRIHIPDFYKSRIAVFDFKGKLQTSKPCPEGISSRMNFFALSSKNVYITFSDYTLYNLNALGKLNWKHQLGIGFIPASLYPGDQAIYLVPSGQDQRAIVYDFASNTPIGRMGFMKEGSGVAIVQSPSGKPYTLELSSMSRLPDNSIGPAQFQSEKKAHLLFIDTSDSSYWKAAADHYETLLVYDADGKKIREKNISYMNSETSGNAFWTVCRNNHLYKNYFFDDHMIVAEYSLE